MIRQSTQRIALAGLGLLSLGGLSARAAEKIDRDANRPPHVVFVIGEDENRSEETMPMLAKILAKRHGMRTSIAYATDDAGRRNPQSKTNIAGLEALRDADLAIFFLRFRQLPEEQLRLILDYTESGKPLIGLRTTTHAFLYEPNHPHAKLNEEFGRKLFGQRWIVHHGNTSSTDVEILPEQAEHPILRGVGRRFHCASWLYHVTPLEGDCTPLLEGSSVNSTQRSNEHLPQANPVAWTKTHNDARVFFTTLGHPRDFDNRSVRRMLINAVYWGLEMEVPAAGADADPVAERRLQRRRAARNAD